MATSIAGGNALHPLRLPRIVNLLREQSLPTEVLLQRLNRQLKADGIPTISIRTLQLDLDWMLDNLGAAGIERVAKADLKPEPPSAFHRYRVFYRLVGAEDLIPITAAPVFLTEMEALALIAAKAQLTTPPTPGLKGASLGPLAEAIGTLMGRLGLDARDPRIPDILAVTHTAPEPYVPAHVLAVLRAIRLGEGLTLTYQALGKPVRTVAVQPIRLALIEGEPYVWAWDGEAAKLKTYKVARVISACARDGLANVPSGLDTDVRNSLSGGFRGVSGPTQRGRVVIRLTATGVPHLRHRSLGSNQVWTDLPDGGARVAFNTSGIDAVKHWLLQCGAQAVVESPAEMVAWFRSEIAQMAQRYQG
jgi:predicted DNA-binding transcriptional regulator YafY